MERASSAKPTPLQPWFGQLLAAARRKARRHRAVLAAVAVLAGGGGAAAAILVPGSSYVATRPIGAALGKSPLVGAGETRGRALVQLGVPTIVRFIPRASFAIAVIVTNKAGEPITLLQARAILPHDSPLRQIGTRLVSFKPFVCPRGALCPAVDPIGPGPYGVPARPLPLQVAPGREALAQVHLRFGACSPVTGAAVPTTKRVVLIYRIPDGRIIRQRLALGRSTPQVTRIPQTRACRR
jgi:hypothetical protein